MGKASMMLLIVMLFAALDYVIRKPGGGVSAPVTLRAAQDEPVKIKIPVTGIQVNFTCDKVKASMADSVVLEVAILNVGKDPAYPYDRLWWGEGGGLLLWLRDDKQERFMPWADPPYPPPPQDDPGRFVRLESGRFYGLREQWHVHGIVRVPGTYTLWVEFQSPVYRENVYDPKLKNLIGGYWFDFQGVNSNQIAFQAVP